jgi:hypothetical protein
MSVIALLGPQRVQPTVASVAARLGIEGRFAVITAGWEEREGEDDELRDQLGGRADNLRLFQRGIQAQLADPPLAEALEQHHEALRREKDLYRQRLNHAMAAAREMLHHASAGTPLVRREQDDAIAAVTALDEHHVRSVREMRAAFAARWRPAEREAVRRRREEIAPLIAGAAAIAIAGGHVGVLLEHLRLFGVLDLAGARPIIAWSAGAMALAERIVLFHDSPPWGAGNAEVHEEGLGACRGILPLPHARRRLRLHDRVRVSLLARRFGAFRCLAMDDGAMIARRDGRTEFHAGARHLRPDGSVVEIGAGDDPA